MNIEALPEKTQQQLRDLMDWTETTSPDKVVIDAIDKAWQAVKLETFGDPKRTITIKASGPSNASAELYLHRSPSWHHVTGNCNAVNQAQQRAYDEAVKYLDQGLTTPAQMALEAVFGQVIVDWPD